jgi:hypothetical protein
MTQLDDVLPEPRRLELDHIDVAVPPARAWDLVRHGDLGRSPLIVALFAIRTLPSRLAGHEPEAMNLRIDDIVSSERPGFRALAEDPGREIVIGAIGKVWQPDIPFVDVNGAEEFAAWNEPGYVKVAWALRVAPLGDHDARVEIEVRVSATSDDAWRRFRAYFLLVGPASRFIRRTLLADLARELSTPEAEEQKRAVPGDELLGDARAQITHGITVRARPEEIWPWLLQMGCRRAGWYSWDALDNAWAKSATEIHPELQKLEVGDALPATPEGEDGFEVLRVDAPRTLILGGLFDPDAKRQLPFASSRPARYWHVTWAFALEPLDERSTRLHVRARAAFPDGLRLHASWIRPVHHFMELGMLHHLAQRVEGRTHRDGWRDVLEGAKGAAAMVIHLLAPFRRAARSRWGLSDELASRPYPGDELVTDPRWSWTHGIEIDASAADVWPWIAQIGADRGGFYSYQWLENLVGCDVRNAEAIHPELAVREGDRLSLHPQMPPLGIVEVKPPRWFVAFAPPEQTPHGWATVSWLFFLEDLGEGRCRFVSRFRSAFEGDLAARFAYGPYLTEPIGFVMDRQMLRGVKARAEARAREALAREPAR